MVDTEYNTAILKWGIVHATIDKTTASKHPVL